jgi:hypothetical protein
MASTDPMHNAAANEAGHAALQILTDHALGTTSPVFSFGPFRDQGEVSLSTSRMTFDASVPALQSDPITEAKWK